MQKILSIHCVHPLYLDFLNAFGAKQDEKDDDMFGGFVSRFWSNIPDATYCGRLLLVRRVSLLTYRQIYFIISVLCRKQEGPPILGHFAAWEFTKDTISPASRPFGS